MSGKTLSIVEENDEGNGVSVSLGYTELWSENVGGTLTGLNEDGFVIRKVGKNIYINGENEYALINGVIYFSEKYLGVKYLTKDYTKYGEISALHLKDVVDETEIPDFKTRDYYASQSMTDQEYAAKLGFETLFRYNPTYNGEGIIFGDIHGIPTEFPYTTYPQYYVTSEDDGSYEIDLTNGFNADWTWNQSNPNSLLSAVIERTKTAILEKPNGKYVVLGTRDSGFVHESNNTSEIVSKFGGYTGLYLHFVNTVADEIYAWMDEQGMNREVRFIAVSFWKTYYPEQCSIQTSEYVDVMVAAMFCGYHTINDSSSTCSGCAEAKTKLLSWKSCLSAKSSIWVYNYATNFTHSLFWYNNFNALQANIAFYKSISVSQVLYQGHPHAYNYYQGNLENYILSKLLWDSSLSVNELVYAYNQEYFGDSASVVNQIYNNMNSYAQEDTSGWSWLDKLTKTPVKLHAELYNNESVVGAVYSLSRLNENIDLLELEISRINGLSTLTAEEKAMRVQRLLELEVQLRYMVLICHEGELSDVAAYAQDLINSLNSLGIKYIGENRASSILNQYIKNN